MVRVGDPELGEAVVQNVVPRFSATPGLGGLSRPARGSAQRRGLRRRAGLLESEAERAGGAASDMRRGQAMAFRCADWPGGERGALFLVRILLIERILTHLAALEAGRIHNPRAPPSELAQRAEPLRAPAAELPVSPSPTVALTAPTRARRPHCASPPNPSRLASLLPCSRCCRTRIASDRPHKIPALGPATNPTTITPILPQQRRSAGWPGGRGAVTHPRLPRIRACPIRAPGSSDNGLAAQRYTSVLHPLVQKAPQVTPIASGSASAPSEPAPLSCVVALR